MKTYKTLINNIINEASEIEYSELGNEEKKFIDSLVKEFRGSVTGLWYGIHGYIVTINTMQTRLDKERLKKFIKMKNFRWIDSTERNAISIGFSGKSL